MTTLRVHFKALGVAKVLSPAPQNALVHFRSRGAVAILDAMGLDPTKFAAA